MIIKEFCRDLARGDRAPKKLKILEGRGDEGSKINFRERTLLIKLRISISILSMFNSMYVIKMFDPVFYNRWSLIFAFL